MKTIDTNGLADRIAQEILSKTLRLDGIGDEHNIQLDAARATRTYLVEIFGVKSQDVPTINEIRTYSVIYNRALKLLNQSE